ncbi:GNAT family N-acetyltransferase [Staphylococcus coagulans]|uniref:GNAT family N-acetyltransferase n=1 Tax=Staphylococcus coagulans TaxID=74706 RepID=UPI001F4BF8D5|nr:GNAT family protein [Staphylococcus coagulans]UNB45927.1 GNAT family N-acetyltransferase [Staphylococcus coagulans]
MHHFRLPIEGDVALVYPHIAYAEEILEVIQQNRGHLRRYLNWVDEVTTVEVERKFLEVMLTQVAKGEALLYLIFDENQFIGMVDLHAFDKEKRKAEVGYWLAEAKIKRGIVTRVVKKLCDIAFEDLTLNKLELRANVENKGSNRIAEKVGFRWVGVKRDDEYIDHQYRDMNYYELLKSDYYA